MTLFFQGVARLGELSIEVDFSLGNEVVAITGVNGIGKTSLLKVIAGLVSLESGTLKIGEEVLDDPTNKIFVQAHERRVGMTFQEDTLLPFLNVQDNIAFPLRASGIARVDARTQAIDAMNSHGIEHLALMRPEQLSGGQKQRVALVRSLITQPKIVLLDEPLSALDATARTEVRSWLRSQLESLSGPKFIVTHDRQDVEQLCDREIMLVQEPNQHSGLRSVATIIR